MAFNTAPIRSLVGAKAAHEGFLASVGSDVPRHMPRAREMLEAYGADEGVRT